MDVDEEQLAPTNIVSELGFVLRRVGDELHGTASITPEMTVPGTGRLRTSVLAIWSDTLAGLLAATSVAPRVPVTMELDVHLDRPAPGSGPILGVGRMAKRGRSVFVSTVEFTSGDGEPIAIAAGSFMSAPDPTVRLPAELGIDSPMTEARAATLVLPLAERARCERLEPGVARLQKSQDGLNSSNTVNGGLIALVAEEAALSLSPGATLCSLGLRYLQPVRVGPVIACATERNGLGRVELRDAGNENRLSVLATTRIFG